MWAFYDKIAAADLRWCSTSPFNYNGVLNKLDVSFFIVGSMVHVFVCVCVCVCACVLRVTQVTMA